MSLRTLIAAALFIPLSGCAVYGYDHDHGYRRHDSYHSHHYYDGYHRDRSPSVYVTPRYYYYDKDRHYDRHYDRDRHDGKYYAPAPSRQHGYDQRQQRHQDGNAQGARRDDGRRHDGRQPTQQKHKQNFSSGKRQSQGQGQQRQSGSKGYAGEQRRY